MLTILHGNALTQLKTLDAESVQTCVTSPPYWGLRDYGVDGQMGLEKTPEAYVVALVNVFREVMRVLRNDGTVWLNLGDSYCASPKGSLNGQDKSGLTSTRTQENAPTGINKLVAGLKPKDLVGIPWMVAFALRADGWYLRSDIVWAKKNCMPEPVLDRPTRSHEYIFLLSKSSRYYYDAEAIKEKAIWDVDATGTASRKARASKDMKSHPTAERAGIRPAGLKDATKMNGKNSDKQAGHSRRHAGFNERWDEAEQNGEVAGTRNKRDVWTIAPAQFAEAHFATFPTEIPTICILAGSKAGDVVLDPFAGSGTTGKVAIELGRKAVLIEPKAEYVEMIERRCKTTIGLPLTTGAIQVA